jgi:hypothetical protein
MHLCECFVQSVQSFAVDSISMTSKLDVLGFSQLTRPGSVSSLETNTIC